MILGVVNYKPECSFSECKSGNSKLLRRLITQKPGIPGGNRHVHELFRGSLVNVTPIVFFECIRQDKKQQQK